jgi:4-amino-4-deoxy-L-arabinose transferase-like glycosyltransferase
MFVRMAARSRRPFLALLLIWGLATAIDLDKPFHVDDAFHLEMAQWIERHPLEPMSGRINWGSGLVPMHTANQPPGFFYLMAFTGHFFGYTPVAMHALRSLFSLLAIVCFFRLARWRCPRQALPLTALLAWGPAFLVNQGVMLDVPLLAFHLLFFDLLLVPRSVSPTWRHALAGLVLSAALFIKFTTLPP